MPTPARTFASKEAREYREALQSWLRKVAPPYRERLSKTKSLADWESVQHDWDRETYRGGYAGISWEPEIGGQGLGPIEEVIFYEEAAYAEAPMGLGRFAQHLVGGVIIEVGTPEQKARLLPGILSGETVTCQGSSEPNAGSDLPAVSTRATRSDDGYTIKGRKIWTSNAHVADWCWMLCKTSDTLPRYRNLSLIIVPMRQPGIEIAPINQITGTSRFSEVTIDGAKARLDDRIGEENAGWQAMVSALGRERGVYQSMWRYLQIRQLLQISEAILAKRNDPALNRDLKKLFTAASALKYQVQRCAEGRIAGRDTYGAETMLKLYWSKLWQDSASFAVDLRSPEHAAFLADAYFESRAGTIWGGTSEIQRNTIADHVLKLPRFDKLEGEKKRAAS